MFYFVFNGSFMVYFNRLLKGNIRQAYDDYDKSLRVFNAKQNEGVYQGTIMVWNQQHSLAIKNINHTIISYLNDDAFE